MQSVDFDSESPADVQQADLSWKPIYEELGSVLLGYRERQDELIATLKQLREREHRVILLNDRDAAGEQFPLAVIDPFTFFASFNRTDNADDRKGILMYLKEVFQLQAPVPTSFDGVPIVNAQASWFFSFASHRKESDVDDLWDLAETAVNEPADELPADLFDRCLRIRAVGLAKLTMGLFWMRPDRFLPLDANSRFFLAARGFASNAKSGTDYIALLSDVRARSSGDFASLSHAAYLESAQGGDQTPADIVIDEQLLQLAIERTIKPLLLDERELYNPEREGYQHERVIPKAASALDRSELEKDGVEAVRAAIAHHGNLISQFEAAKSRDFFLQVDATEAHARLEDLLYGTDAVEYRLRRFLDWAKPRPGEGGKLADVNATVASYLLAVTHPETVAFCKPSIYQEAARALLGESHDASDPAARVVHATRFYTAALRLFQEQGLPFRDLMHVHIAFYVMQATYHGRPRWSDLKEDAPAEKGTAAVNDVREPIQSYAVADALQDLFFNEVTFQSWIDALRIRKNVILQGPPGVGKTFVAKRLAYALMGERDPRRVEMVQFHQAYTYEDFIQGFRPHEGGGFRLRKGPFMQFCERAGREPDTDFVFVIDEVNRGNLGKIFGELMMLIEPDKRGPEWGVQLTYGSGDSTTDGDGPPPRFFVPDNVHLLGMMNTADRSLALVDYALRRRFAFVSLEPRFTDARFRTHLEKRGAPASLVDRVIEQMEDLNAVIRTDTANLGSGFCIGHSYFCGTGGTETLDDSWYRRVINLEIAPLVREYWFDRPEQAASIVAKLLDSPETPA